MKLTFQNGSVTRTEQVNGATQTLQGAYAIDQEGDIRITYTDGSTQTVRLYASAELFLMDVNTGVHYTKVN